MDIFFLEKDGTWEEDCPAFRCLFVRQRGEEEEEEEEEWVT